MSFQRRRYPYYHRLRRLLPLVIAVSLSLLVLFAFLSFLAPHPGDSDRLPLRLRHTSVTLSLTIYLPPFLIRVLILFFVFSSKNRSTLEEEERVIRSNQQQLSEFRLVSGFILFFFFIIKKFKAFDFFLNGWISLSHQWVILCLCVCVLQRDGGRSDRDVWRSRNAEFFYGCSNATTKFPSALFIHFLSHSSLLKVGNF